MIALSTPPLLGELEDRCPTCDQPIPNERVKEIRERLKTAAEQQRAEIEAQAAARYENQLAAVRQEAAAAVLAAQADAAKGAEKARVDGRKEAEVAGAAALDAEKAARAKAEQDVAAAQANIEATVSQRLDQLRQETQAEQMAAATALDAEKAARAKAEQELAAAQAGIETTVSARVTEARVALEEAHTQEVAELQAKSFSDNQKLLREVDDLKRKLEQKSNDDLGDGAEVKVFDALSTAFPGDDIRRVKKGQPGADILHRITENGRICGTIVYDSKNRIAWRNDYVDQLRKDQIAAKAEHAVLATRVFPKPHRELATQDGVILVNPARVVALVRVLREQSIMVAGLRLSEDARQEKTAVLYDFINSERCHLLFDRIDEVAEELLDLAAKERSAHEHMWAKRDQLVRNGQQARAALVNEISQIVHGSALVELRKAT